jgi:hypothetical protein
MTFKRDHALEKSDEHYTPKWLFDRMGIEFDLDVASPIGGSYVPTRKYYTEEDDGLAQDWSGVVWMNPPFSKPQMWGISELTNSRKSIN